MTVVLAGTPVMAAVCAALCMPGKSHTSSHPSMPASNTQARPDATASSHDHTRATLAYQEEPAHAARRADTTELNAADVNCCSSATPVVGVWLAAARADAHALVATAASVTLPLYARFSGGRAPTNRSLAAPPLPLRGLIVLRV